MQPWWPTYSRTILIAHGSERGTCPVDAGGAVVVSRVQQPRAKCTAPPAFPLTSGPVLDEASVHPQQPRPRPQLDPPPAHLQPDFPHPSPSDRVRVSLPLGPPEDLLRLRSPSCRPHALRSRLLCHRLAPAIAMRPTTSAWPAFLRRSIFPLYAWPSPRSCTTGPMLGYRPDRALNGAHRSERTLPADGSVRVPRNGL